MIGKVLPALYLVIGIVMFVCGLYLAYRGISGLLRARKDPSLKDDADYMSHFAQNTIFGLSAIGHAGVLFWLRSSIPEDLSGSMNLKNLPAAIVIILIGYLMARNGPPFPKKEIKILFAYFRLKFFGFRVADAAAVVTGICECVKEDQNCTDKLRSNMDLIATKFKDLNTVSAQKDLYKEMYNRIRSLEKNNPDAKGWEKETTEIIARLM